ncbi:tumor necrosis factor receptor superfamily member 14-like isoform X4 [Etheostoma cragini]|uniref:tumor necrosis factor receptor superfamily member 14-like isoform X4 n=1 Tax=Etheostoma cragini TaxID=417921 RepID=UPI00155F4550|nr:tumor necrosis factor receptor superfamily member 14-like isoform X4 [Etheostoma cragini]
MLRKHLRTAPLLVLVLSVFRGHTLTCRRSEYLIGDKCCPTCSAGSGLKIKTACTTTSDTVCEPLEGFYCTDSSENGCVKAEKHSSCQPGQYIRQKGTAFRDTECSECSDGTFSDGTLFPSCQPHTQCEALNLQLIKPGNASTDAECGEPGSRARISIAVVLVTCLVIVIALCFKNNKYTGMIGI